MNTPLRPALTGFVGRLVAALPGHRHMTVVVLAEEIAEVAAAVAVEPVEAQDWCRRCRTWERVSWLTAANGFDVWRCGGCGRSWRTPEVTR